MFFTVSVAFFYYTFWVMIMPFVDDDHILQSYFPDRCVHDISLGANTVPQS